MSSPTARPSRRATSASRSATSVSVRRRKSKRWQRERIVAGILWRSVVARMKTAWDGGSSSVLRSAWKAAEEIAWTSSMMKTFRRSRAGAKLTISISSRAWSTLPCVAPSISSVSIERPSSTSRHEAQLPHGVGVGCSEEWQLIAAARSRAEVVFPTPRGPEKRYAWASRSWETAFVRARTISSCPTTSAKERGRHFRANGTKGVGVVIGFRKGQAPR